MVGTCVNCDLYGFRLRSQDPYAFGAPEAGTARGLTGLRSPESKVAPFVNGDACALVPEREVVFGP